MKRTIFGVAALALMLSASTAQAQRPVSFGIALGATMPSGDFADGADMGYHAMGTLSFSPPALPVGVRIDGMFNQLAAKGGADVNYRILGLIANATFGMPMAASPISPYLIGGLGYYNLGTDMDDEPLTPVDESESVSKMGFNLGVGTKFALAGFGTFAEIRYHSIQTEGSSTTMIPITFGITF